jgi:dTDP-4-amino-4,6-dideoxygalactose transaminase
MFSNHGRESKYDHEFEGINSRLDALQAALLSVCLPLLDGWNAHRRQAAAWYDAGLAGIQPVIRPRRLPDTEPVYHLYVVQVPDREALRAHLKQQKIETGIHYPMSLNLLPAYAHRKEGPGHFPRAEYACAHMLSLPMHPHITREEVARVCDAIRAFYAKP